ncbi:MAG: hypothetical protein KF767_12645 [Bdellovibrionaceae bacterium]|nr:hypothetical protein [Pseudobdellovibrionaceae bacterium]
MKLKWTLIALQALLLGGFAFHHWRTGHQVDAYVQAITAFEQEQKRNPAEAPTAWLRSPLLVQIQDFVKANGPTHEQENTARLRENPCFEKLVARFYAQVRLQDVKSALNERLLMAKAAQTQTLGPKTDPPEGWLWKLAVDHARGDHNLAFGLIGVCSLPGSNISWTEEEGLLRTERDEVLKQVQALSREVASNASEAEEIEFIVKSHLEKPVCPAASSKMYWPRSLGPNYAISAAALSKEEDRDAHYENVVHSAFSSCLLYQKGMPGPVIEELQERLRGLQRAERMCHLLQTAHVQADTLKMEDFDWTGGSVQSLLKTLVSDPRMCEGGATDFSPELQPLADRLCPVIRNQAPTTKNTRELLIASQQAFIDLDTALFVRMHPQWRLTPSCDTADGRGRLAGLLNSAMNVRCPGGWSPARCVRVMKNLESWMRDDLYQADQVRAGLTFSRLHCAGMGPGVSPLANACKVVENP